MINQLPLMTQPDWLSHITDKDLSDSFPLKKVLQSSLYYPASGFDGTPVAHLAGNIFSFVYVDYGRSRDELIVELRSNGFLGYRVIGQRSVAERELVPNGWMPIHLRPDDGDPEKYQEWIKEPFCEWMIFERDEQRGEEHGPSRFSLVHLCADGVAAFQSLYVRNRLRPRVIAIIQPGHAFGGNWTNFTDETAPLARAVRSNRAGQPDFLLYGGFGQQKDYDRPCWSQFDRFLGFLGEASVGVWRRGNLRD